MEENLQDRVQHINYSSAISHKFWPSPVVTSIKESHHRRTLLKWQHYLRLALQWEPK